jgi:hypothetical protein
MKNGDFVKGREPRFAGARRLKEKPGGGGPVFSKNLFNRRKAFDMAFFCINYDFV